ncbi:MAG: rhodanese-like domain-containing protein [Desulfobacteraceae bacterium]|nr:rhodanese-like domain-containing protein [Desulfobacteraceae bacterium]
MITKKNIIVIIIAVMIVVPLLPLLAIAGGLVYARIAGTDKADDGFALLLPNEAGFYEITADQLAGRIYNESGDDYLIVDIRDDASYDEGHIPGAINIPLNELGYRLFSLDKSKDIIVCCFIGVTSEVACRILVNAGFKDVYNLIGGMRAWDYAIETSDGRVNI